MKTKAVIFTKENTYITKELEIDSPKSTDIVVKTLVSAISPGTERWILRGKHIGTEFPCVPGYHRIGIVEECGKNVKNFQKGDIVYGTGNRWKEKIISMWGAHIGYSVSNENEYKLVSTTKLNNAELENLSFIMLAGVAARGIRFLEIKKDDKLVIIGGGILGATAYQLAKFHGGDPILIEPNDDRRKFLKDLIPNMIKSADESIKLKRFAPAGYDKFYDTVGHAETTDKLVQLMKNQSTMLLQVQYFDKLKCAINLDQIKIREITMKTTIGIDDEDFEYTTDKIKTRTIKMGAMISHRFTPDNMLKGYELLDKNKEHNLGMIINWE